MKYPFLDLSLVNRPYAGALKEACLRVIDSGHYIGGEEVEAFEAKLAGVCGTRHAVGCGNGLDALRLSLTAAIETGRLRRGDEVIVPSNTYIATVLAITQSGLKPVFAEPNRDTMELDAGSLRKALTPGARALMTVHLYGRPAWDDDMAEICRREGLLLFEDNAQAIGARLADGRHTGSLGLASGMSFYPTKNVGALGDAGAVTTDDDEMADTVRQLRNYGSGKRYFNRYEGLNSRLDPIQAAMVAVKLDFVEEENDGRRRLAEIYKEKIRNEAVQLPPDYEGREVFHQFVVRVEDRDSFRTYLAQHGVGTDIHYPVPPHRQQCYPQFNKLPLPIADTLAAQVVSLPISPACTSENDAAAISEIINEYRP